MVGCSPASPELGFQPHFPAPPALSSRPPRLEYHLSQQGFDYVARALTLPGPEPLNGKSYQAEIQRVSQGCKVRVDEHATPFQGISQQLDLRRDSRRTLMWVTQQGDSRILYVAVTQLQVNPDRPLELERVCQQFTEGARL